MVTYLNHPIFHLVFNSNNFDGEEALCLFCKDLSTMYLLTTHLSLLLPSWIWRVLYCFMNFLSDQSVLFTQLDMDPLFSFPLCHYASYLVCTTFFYNYSCSWLMQWPQHACIPTYSLNLCSPDFLSGFRSPDTCSVKYFILCCVLLKHEGMFF